MKRLLIFGLFSCLILPLHAMHFKADPADIQKAKAAHESYREAVYALDRQAIAAAVVQVKETRTLFPWWKQWVGYANISLEDQPVITRVLSDAHLFGQFENRIDYLSWNERQSRQDELAAIRDTISRSLGQGIYIDARDAYWSLIYATKECDPDKITESYKTLKRVRELFSWTQKLGLTFFTEGDYRGYEYKNRIFSNATLAQEALRHLYNCKDTERCTQTIKALEEEIPLQPFAVSESNRTDGFAGNHLQNPVVLATLYQLKTPLNSAQLLEYAQKYNKKEMRDTILKFNPDLKV